MVFDCFFDHNCENHMWMLPHQRQTLDRITGVANFCQGNLHLISKVLCEIWPNDLNNNDCCHLFFTLDSASNCVPHIPMHGDSSFGDIVKRYNYFIKTYSTYSKTKSSYHRRRRHRRDNNNPSSDIFRLLLESLKWHQTTSNIQNNSFQWRLESIWSAYPSIAVHISTKGFGIILLWILIGTKSYNNDRYASYDLWSFWMTWWPNIVAQTEFAIRKGCWKIIPQLLYQNYQSTTEVMINIINEFI